MAILNLINWGWLNSCSFLEIIIVKLMLMLMLMVQMVQISIAITMALTLTLMPGSNNNKKNRWTNYKCNNSFVCYCTKYKLKRYK